MINTLLISGAGIKGISYLGAIKILEEKKILNFKFINKYVGISIGSIISLFFILDYNVNEIIEFTKQFNFKFIIDNFDINKLLINKGFIDFSYIQFILLEIIYQKIHNSNEYTSKFNNKNNLKNITFLDLFNLTNKEFIIVITNYNSGTPLYLSHLLTPDYKIIDSIYKSITIPFIFEPINDGKYIWIDGAISDNLPMHLCNIDTTIGLCMDINLDNNYDDFFSYLKGIFNILSVIKINKNYTNIIKINIDYINFINFDISIDTINKLINDGYNQTNYIINKSIKKMCNNIINQVIDNLFIVSTNDFIDKQINSDTSFNNKQLYCQSIIKSGKNKNNICGRKLNYSLGYYTCRYHH